MTKKLIVQDWVNQISTLLASESFKLLKSQGTEKGGLDLANQLYSAFLEKYIEKMLVEALTVTPTKALTEKKNYEFTRVNFISAKTGIQDSIANAFSNSLSNFTSQKVDYYVEVKTVPDPVSKLSN